jgi:hypothetical protein
MKNCGNNNKIHQKKKRYSVKYAKNGGMKH